MKIGTLTRTTGRRSCAYAWSSTPLGWDRCGIPQTDYCIRLGAFLSLDDVELNVIALFQRLVPVQLNR